ncbi:MAG: hypothetical protein AAB212_02510 [Bacteroidota bacterium]
MIHDLLFFSSLGIFVARLNRMLQYRVGFARIYTLTGQQSGAKVSKQSKLAIIGPGQTGSSVQTHAHNSFYHINTVL